ncbi:hypothetical protein AALP_AA4G082300 [Arabis alpina]|uniref:Uncharacterized protein n=1 Tax=Arabis alpina TaxID=50452 RepID=A0A087H1Y6_ARAAL|nr:hypothetical protein AALP_AA4G082300 [Arabis alpina]
MDFHTKSPDRITQQDVEEANIRVENNQPRATTSTALDRSQTLKTRTWHMASVYGPKRCVSIFSLPSPLMAFSILHS